MFIYDLLTSDRNRLIRDPDRRIPKARFLSHNELIELFPGVERKNLTGAAVFCDGQMYNPTRLAVSFLRAAVDGGAEAANYLEAIGFLRTKRRIYGIKVRDQLTDEEFEIHGKVVLNAAGPWAERLNFNELRLEWKRTGIYSRDACFVVRRRFAHGYALAVQGRTRDPDAILSRSARHLFVVPWRDYSLIGVWHVVHDGHPGEFTVTERELQSFIDEINGAYRGLDLTLDDILLWNAGLVPFGDNEPGSTDLSYGKRSILIDHAREHNLHGLVTLIGIRYTMARGDSARAIDLIATKLGHRAPNPPTDRTPVHGGRIECFEELVREARQEKKFDFSDKVIRALLHNYGAEYGRVLKFASRNPSLVEVIGDSTVIKAEVIHAVREEMALKLADVVLRRTDLGTGEYPGIDTLQTCAQLMAPELGWTVERIRDEIAAVMRAFPLHADGPDRAISGVAS
jgi:glycerol-3-phosphate dehydrogenase